MFRATVRATEETNVEIAVADLRADCEHEGLTPVLTDLVTAQTRDLLEQLIQRGKQLASSGSQMQVTRGLSGEGYSVKLMFQTGVQHRRSFLARMLDSLLRR